MCESVDRSQRLPECFCNSSGQGGRALNANLLTKNRPHRKLKRIPTSRQSEPRSRLHGGCQYRISSQRRNNRVPIGIDVKHPPHSLDDHEKRARITEIHPRNERGILLVERDFKPTMLAVQRNRTAIATVIYDLNAGRTSERQT